MTATSGTTVPTPPASPAPGAGGSTRRPRRWVIYAVVLVVVIVAVSVALLATVPVKQSYTFSWGDSSSGSGTVTFNDSFGQQLCPSGATASLTYSSDGISATFGVVAPNGTTIWSSSAPNGNTTFPVATCGEYTLTADGSGVGSWTMDGTVRYTAPLF